MTYGEFLATFLGIPVLAALPLIGRRLWLTLGGVALLALVYTAPWDNLIVLDGVWSYGPHRVAGVILGHVPLEEYAFYVLQVILTGTFTALLLRRS